ncbi:hypothetical protein CQZ94_18110 [Bacillus sp. MYb209]|uniref:hypothetical protein n=1 Tax=Bacillus TaxID=1386 RepID=UPI000CFBC5E0|nr:MULTISPECIES: hypothetical protein [Bacillus]MDR4903079.1 hypothetical protein [Bacillus mycoides]PQZ54488.1 hypothetical protein CQZ94_18110 [Bacillus sp. MYb209]
MAKCCDRCKQPINPKEMCKVKVEIRFREYVRNFLLSFQRKINGMADYDDMITTGNVEMCESCRNSLLKFLNGADVVKTE